MARLISGFKEMPVNVGIGVYEEEKQGTQTIFVSFYYVYSQRRVNLLSQKDDFIFALDYQELADYIKAYLEKTRWGLLEYCSLSLLKAIKRKYPEIKRYYLRLDKPAGVPGSRGSFSIYSTMKQAECL